MALTIIGIVLPHGSPAQRLELKGDWPFSEIADAQGGNGPATHRFYKSRLGRVPHILDVAETDHNMGNREHVERTCSNAEKGYSDMIRFYSQATGITAQVAEELQSKFKQPRERLDGLQRLR
jgi:hypothetical protein